MISTLTIFKYQISMYIFKIYICHFLQYIIIDINGQSCVSVFIKCGQSVLKNKGSIIPQLRTLANNRPLGGGVHYSVDCAPGITMRTVFLQCEIENLRK